jgi:hypothetical protein
MGAPKMATVVTMVMKDRRNYSAEGVLVPLTYVFSDDAALRDNRNDVDGDLAGAILEFASGVVDGEEFNVKVRRKAV